MAIIPWETCGVYSRHQQETTTRNIMACKYHTLNALSWFIKARCWWIEASAQVMQKMSFIISQKDMFKQAVDGCQVALFSCFYDLTNWSLNTAVFLSSTKVSPKTHSLWSYLPSVDCYNKMANMFPKCRHKRHKTTKNDLNLCHFQDWFLDRL